MNVKLILLQSVPNLGRKGDIVEVSKGYARNFLIAKGLGRKIIEAEIERNEKEKEIRDAKIKERLLKNKDIKNKLSNKRVSLKQKASSRGTLYAAVSSEDIAEAIRETYGFELPCEAIQVKSVKSLGLHPFKVSIQDQGDVSMKLKVYDIKDST